MPTTIDEASKALAEDTNKTLPQIQPTESSTPPDPLISRRVRKTFGEHGTFEGSVSYKDNKNWYTVTYDDGDTELPSAYAKPTWQRSSLTH
jgi:hypothetical protein